MPDIESNEEREHTHGLFQQSSRSHCSCATPLYISTTWSFVPFTACKHIPSGRSNISILCKFYDFHPLSEPRSERVTSSLSRDGLPPGPRGGQSAMQNTYETHTSGGTPSPVLLLLRDARQRLPGDCNISACETRPGCLNMPSYRKWP